MFNLLKTSLIQMAGKLTDAVEPFEELTRQLPMSATDLTHDERAVAFEADLLAKFKLSNGVYAYRIGDNPRVIGDEALFHGLATAMWSFKYAVTEDPSDEQRLYDSALAMEHHFRGPHKWLIRGVDPSIPDRFADDASNDSATGPLIGAYFAWLHGSKRVKEQAGRILFFLANELFENNMCLMRQDGTPTTYGRLESGFKTDPLRVSLAMAIFYAAWRSRSRAVFKRSLDLLVKRYEPLLTSPDFKFLWLTHAYEAHRAAIHLSILGDYPETKDAALKGLRQILWCQRKAGNSWILALAQRHRILSAREIVVYRGRQLEYEPLSRGPDVERLNTTRADFWKEQGVRFVKWGDQVRATQALPYWMLASQDFFPQRHPFQADGWEGHKTPSGYHSGLDFLVSHWLGRLGGLIDAHE